MKKTLYLLSFASLLAASCTTKNNVTPTPTPTPTPTAPKTSVMYVNAYTGGAMVSIQANDTITPSASLAYLGNTGYMDMIPGTLRSVFKLLPASIDITENTMTVTADAHYTIFLAGSITSGEPPASIAATTDDVTAPASGKAKFRFINLSTGNYNEALKLDTSVVTSSVGYKTVTNFSEMTAGNHTISIENASHPAVVVTNNFLPGKVYTLMLTGRWTASNNTLKLTIISNN